ncbi:MAG: 50S ribosomal protein L11 methyltransferase [SAR202 cluster bacterium]|nr:50S ribosomal protein L11 methyltransferase [SAR202 cluster bacterium]|tara:strand:- start:18324 stop:19226 length:903 start_codon:yes stop_codon:yes gene_type:complete
MKWLELSLITPSEYVEPLSLIFHRYGHGGVAEEIEVDYNPDEGEVMPDNPNVILRTYMPIDEFTESRKQEIQIAIALISKIADLSPLKEQIIQDNDWMNYWKNHFPMLKIGRIIICPSWIQHTAEQDEILIALDPGMAFGTGHHPTTKMCISEIEKLFDAGTRDRVLDIGTGSGILAMVAATLGATGVLGIDTDPLAVTAAMLNIETNKLENRVEIIQGTIEGNDLSQYDLVVANLYSKVIMEIGHSIMSKVDRNGMVILSGIMKDKLEEVIVSLRTHNFVLDHYCTEGDWAVVVGHKYG